MGLFNAIVDRLVRYVARIPDAERVLNRIVLDRLPQAAYARMKEQGFRPGGVIDVGAHEGNWTRLVKSIFPDVPVLMVEAREEQRIPLIRVCSSFVGVECAIALVGSTPMDAVQFHVLSTGSSIYEERSNVPRTTCHLPMRTLDDVMQSHRALAEPLFLKLDVQGAELDVLRGGSAALAMSEMVQLEVPILNYNDGAPQSYEVVDFMEKHGFVIFDIAGLVRPNGLDLLQIDILFSKRASMLRRDHFSYPT